MDQNPDGTAGTTGLPGTSALAEHQGSGGAGFRTSLRHELEPVGQGTVERNADPHVETAPDEREAERLACLPGDFHTVAAEDALARLIDDLRMPHVPFNALALAGEAFGVRSVQCGIMPQLAVVRGGAVTVEAPLGFGLSLREG